MEIILRGNIGLLRACIPAAILLILLTTHGVPFLQGFRLTADDVNYHMVVMKGFENALAFVFELAIGQGRVVHLVDVPFTLIGSYYADYTYFRVFYTILYFANYIFFSIYVSKLFRMKIPHIMAVILIAITPLDYYHLPPNAYPFHASLPIFLILISRLGIIHLNETGRQSFKKELLFYALFFIGILFSELAFIFGFCLSIAEFTIRSLDRFSHPIPARTKLALFVDRIAIADCLAIATFLSLYLAFRIYFPSNYEGNKLSADIDIAATITTLIGHVYGGTAFSSFTRHGIPAAADIEKASSIELSVYILAFMTTFAYSFYAMRKVYSIDLRSRYFAVLVFFGGLIAILSTLPIALVKKYQDWCVIYDVCIFHDARISIFGFGLILMGILLFTAKIQKDRFLSYATISIISLTLATISVLTLFNNITVSKDMRDYVTPWYRAQQIACGFRDRKENRTLASQLYFNRAVSTHAEFDVEEYWRTYIGQFPMTRCSSVPQQLLMTVHSAELSEGIDFSLQSWPSFLSDVGGLSVLEPWGRWSDASLVPSVNFYFVDVLPRRFEIVADVTVFGPNAQQTMQVRVGDQQFNVILPVSEGVIRIPVDNVNSRSIEFLPPHPVSPGGQDNRKVAVGFRKLNFEIHP